MSDLPPPPAAPPDGGTSGDGRSRPGGGRGFDRVPPHSLEAEVSALGAALLSRNAASEVVELLGPDDFYRTAHRVVFEGVRELMSRGEPVDAVTLLDWLARNDRIDEVGGAGAVHDLADAVPTAANAAYYARIVHSKALLRRLIEAGTSVAKLGYESAEDATTVVDQAEALIYEVAQSGTTSDYVALNDLLNDSLAEIERLADKGDDITGLATGFNDFDSLTAGLQPSNLVIIAARPSLGKSSLAMGVAKYVTAELRQPAVFFSLEMSKLEIVSRLLSAEAQIDSKKIRTGQLDENDWRKLSDALGKLAEAPLFIDDTAAITLMEIRSKCRRIKQRHGLELVIVDYLQLMNSHRRADNRQQEVAEISRGLKMLAKELEVPVLALSQLSRQPEARTDKRPMLSDLRESGCVTGETRILRADTGASVRIDELVRTGERDIPVWTLDRDRRLRRATMTHAFSSGRKMVYELVLASGRRLRLTASHPVLKLDGWTPTGALEPDDRIAVPRTVGPPLVGKAIEEAELVMLAHLIGDGCFVERQPLHYTNNDPANLEAVENAAGHWGVTPRRVAQKTWWHVYLPAPYPLTHRRRNPIVAWLDELGLYGRRSYQKFVPDVVFGAPDEQVALFLHHLWATDGHIGRRSGGQPAAIHYSSNSRRLVEDVQQLLLRLNIRSRLKTSRKGDHRPGHLLWVTGRDDQVRFLERVGAHGRKAARAAALLDDIRDVNANTNVDTLPIDVWHMVREERARQGMSERAFQAAIGTHYCGTTLYKSAPSRQRLGRVATVLEAEDLEELATSDVFWDRVVSVDAIGVEDVYDATVPGTHNFVGNGVVLHNSLEQDSDIVGFLYRDEVYNEDTPDRGIAELIVAKHRNGATGIIKLAFLSHLTTFANLARGTSGGGGAPGGQRPALRPVPDASDPPGGVTPV